MDTKLSEIAQDVIEACPVTGLMIKENTQRGHPSYIHAPMTLFPTPYPLDMYKKAHSLQASMGDLIGGIIADSRQNIHALLADFAAKDNFMAKLIEVSQAYAD